MVKRIFVALAILLILGGFLTCKNPLHKFDNPVDPDSDNYIGVPSEDNDGDGIGQYDDVDEIVLISPENGTTVSELPLLLTVYKFNPEKVKKYWIQVSTDNQDFDSGIVFDKDDYNSNECTISVDNFENNKVYYWRAKAYDGSKWSDNWSEIRSFNLDIDLTVPQNPSPSNGSAIIDTTPLLGWEVMESATGYHIEVNTDSGFTGTVIADDDTLNASPLEYLITGALSDNTTYYWHVKIKNEDGVWGDWSSTWSFAIDIAPPTTPSPSNDSTIIETTPLLDWEDVASATGYHIEVNTNNSFTGTVIANDDTLTASQYPITGALSDNTTYYWHVKTKNEDGVWGDWSSTWSFSVDMEEPTTPSPSNGSTIIDTTPLLDWEDVTGASGYHIQVNTASNFSGTTIADDDTLTPSEYQVTTVLDYFTTYYWRVRIKDSNDVFGDWSSTWSFSIEPAIGDSYAGGIVFFLDGIGGGLVAAPSDQSTAVEWGAYGIFIGGTSKDFGTGAANTTAIVDALGSGNYAARICYDLVLNGYDDWFLPSRYELKSIYLNLYLHGIGGFAVDIYWSSSENPTYINFAYIWDFGSGYQYSDYPKSSTTRVRAVRAF